VAHAYLFCGSRGVGKTTLARLFAKALNCQSPTSELEPCNQCPSCLEITSGQSLDVIEIDGASNRGIDDIRQINETVGYAPSHGKYKIYIIDEVHMLTKEAFNALLKTLEEPPPRTLLILILANPRALPATVLSRCQRVRFRPLGEPEMAACLQARGVDAATGRRLARWSQGQLGVALAADVAAVETRRQAALDLLGTPLPRLVRRLEEMGLDRDRAAVSACLEVYWMWFRDALCLQAGGDSMLLVNVDRREELAGLAARMSHPALVAALAAVKEAWLALEGNVSPRLALEQVLLGVAAA